MKFSFFKLRVLAIKLASSVNVKWASSGFGRSDKLFQNHCQRKPEVNSQKQAPRAQGPLVLWWLPARAWGSCLWLLSFGPETCLGGRPPPRCPVNYLTGRSQKARLSLCMCVLIRGTVAPEDPDLPPFMFTPNTTDSSYRWSLAERARWHRRKKTKIEPTPVEYQSWTESIGKWWFQVVITPVMWQPALLWLLHSNASNCRFNKKELTNEFHLLFLQEKNSGMVIASGHNWLKRFIEVGAKAWTNSFSNTGTDGPSHNNWFVNR